MPQHYEYEEYVRTRRESPRRDRDHSPEYRSGGGSAREREENPRGSKDAFVREVMTLEHPQDSRPRSVPPLDPHQMARRRSPSPDLYYQSRSPSRAPSGRRHRRDSSSSQVSRRRDRSESPMTRAKSAIDDSFTRSTTGIGASILGAVAGGLAARQAGEVLARRSREKEGGHRRRSDAEKDDRIRLASTIIGAAIGGLGANAIANRYEDSRERGRSHQDPWEDRWGSREALPPYEAAGRNDPRSSRRGLPEPEYEDDHVYDRRRFDDDPRRDDARSVDSRSRYDDGPRRDNGRPMDPQPRYDDSRRYDDGYETRRYDDRY